MAAPARVIGRRPANLPIGLHVPVSIGPLYQSVTSPFGERYSTDELHHRVVVERSGERCAFGRPGDGAGELSFPRGIAFMPGRTRGSSRLFVADAWNDRVQVFDGNGLFVFAFGGRGTGPGLLNAPSGLALVTPDLPGDETHASSEREPMLAVADRENHRIQVFALDGTLVALVGGGDGIVPPAVPTQQRRNWPLASGGDIVLRYPSKVVWDRGVLAIACAGGGVVYVDLAAAMLPAPAPAGGRGGLRLVARGGVRCDR